MPYAFEEDAFCTLMLHCFKHPADAVNGVLLGRETSPGDVEIVKAVPLSHGMLALAPMLEAAFLQIDEYCSTCSLTIVGYYHANERRADAELGHVARKIGERVRSRFNSACIVLVDNRNMQPSAENLSLTAHALSGSSWQPVPTKEVTLHDADAVVSRLNEMIEAGAQHRLNDFDSHLDDVSRPWLDQRLAAGRAA